MWMPKGPQTPIVTTSFFFLVLGRRPHNTHTSWTRRPAPPPLKSAILPQASPIHTHTVACRKSKQGRARRGGCVVALRSKLVKLLEFTRTMFLVVGLDRRIKSDDLATPHHVDHQHPPASVVALRRQWRRSGFGGGAPASVAALRRRWWFRARWRSFGRGWAAALEIFAARPGFRHFWLFWLLFAFL
jgi:hypothetical protein